jgi:hypothetical protein
METSSTKPIATVVPSATNVEYPSSFRFFKNAINLAAFTPAQTSPIRRKHLCTEDDSANTAEAIKAAGEKVLHLRLRATFHSQAKHGEIEKFFIQVPAVFKVPSILFRASQTEPVGNI